MGGALKKRFALLIIILLVSAAYVIYAAKSIGIWGVLLCISVWILCSCERDHARTFSIQLPML